MKLRCLLLGHRWFYVAEYPDGLVLRSWCGAFAKGGIGQLHRVCNRCGDRQHLQEIPAMPFSAARLPRSAWVAQG